VDRPANPQHSGIETGEVAAITAARPRVDRPTDRLRAEPAMVDPV